MRKLYFASKFKEAMEKPQNHKSGKNQLFYLYGLVLFCGRE